VGKPTGFLEVRRAPTPKRPVAERLRDWREVEIAWPETELRAQAERCMDCGIPFCHKACPLGNYIPDWNELVGAERWRAAIERLHATNNFPEFTGLTCPAPCEEACVLNINDDPVAIKQIERQIVERAWAEGWVRPRPAPHASGRRVAVVGSGPAGLAAAQQLARAGHAVTVLERDDRLGGLLRYGIPDFKMEKHHIDRRLAQMANEGVVFRPGVEAGADLSAERLVAEFDAVLLALGAQAPRRLPVPGHELAGVHYAMEYLSRQNRVVAGDSVSPLSAAGKRVAILGGGDTGADCLGTAHRQGAREVFHFHYKPAPPASRTADMPWPWWPMVLRESSSHEEGGVRDWSVVTKAFTGDERGRVRGMHCVRVEWAADADGRPRMREVEASAFDLNVDLVLVAIGFTGPETAPLAGLGLALSERGTVAVGEDFQTSFPGVFACGDATRGASLVVWAIWEGREAARAIDVHLTGASDLPSVPNRVPL